MPSRSETFHGEGDAAATEVDLKHFDAYMLVEVNHLRGIVDTTVGQLADVDKTVLMHADVDKSPEGGDVGHDAGQYHPLLDILDAGDILVEFEYLKSRTRVKAGFVQFLHYVLEGGKAAVG